MKITYVSVDNMSQHGQVMKAQYKLRHRAFLERQSYKVHSYNDMEYDQYDNPSAIYLVCMDDTNERALGVSRLTPVAHRSMLQDLYPDMVNNKNIFYEKNIWEGTRFCVEKELNAAQRKDVANALVGAYFEFGFAHGAHKIIGIMPNYILKRVFRDSGCDYETLGSIKIIDGQKIQAASLDINMNTFKKFQNTTGIFTTSIQNLPTLKKQAA